MRLLALAAVSTFLLAGCSGADPAAPAPTSTSAAPVPQPDVPEPVLLTDTLHFADAPHLTGAAPTGNDPIRVPIEPIAPEATAGIAKATWELPRPDGLDVFMFQAKLYIEVKGTFVNLDQNGCFWSVFITVHSGNGEGSSAPYCGVAGPTVNSGLHEVAVANRGWDLSDEPGRHIRLKLSMTTAPTPGSTATLLTGAIDTDSTITIDGLQLPIDTRTLL